MHYVFAIHVTTTNAGQGTEKEEICSMHQRHNSDFNSLSISFIYTSGSQTRWRAPKWCAYGNVFLNYCAKKTDQLLKRYTAAQLVAIIYHEMPKDYSVWALIAAVLFCNETDPNALVRTVVWLLEAFLRQQQRNAKCKIEIVVASVCQNRIKQI
jgi:hypothetical protein